jgi:hypothetical protein
MVLAKAGNKTRYSSCTLRRSQRGIRLYGEVWRSNLTGHVLYIAMTPGALRTGHRLQPGIAVVFLVAT